MSLFATNRDQLRVMTSEEIAVWLSRFVLACVNNAKGGGSYELSPNFVRDAVEWLNQPYDPKDWEEVVAIRSNRVREGD